MKDNDANDLWRKPQRQSPAAIGVLITSTAVNLLKGFWPVLALYFFRQEKDDSLTIFSVLIGFALLSILGAVIGYWFKKFYVIHDTLVIQSGWLKKKTLSIPIHTIQAVHLEQNLWQQIFGVTSVSFDSVGSDDIEAKLDAIPVAKAGELKSLLMDRKPQELMKEVGVGTSVASPTYRLALVDLLNLSLTANHLEAFFILTALLFNLLDEVKQIFGGDDYIDTYGRNLLGQTVFALITLLVGVIIISVLFSIFRTMIKYYGFRLVETEGSWTISYGLFDKTKRLVPINKIQIIQWKANWLRRKIDYWTVQIQAIGHKENKKQNIHIPVISFQDVIYLVDVYQPFEEWDTERALMISSDYWKRSARRSLIILLIPTALMYVWLGWPALVILVLYPLMVWNDFKWYSNFRWQTNGVGIQLMSGVFGRKFSLLSWKKIQQVQLSQNFYQRNRALASVVFITAGGKLTLPYIPLSTANLLVDQVLYDVESRKYPWM